MHHPQQQLTHRTNWPVVLLAIGAAAVLSFQVGCELNGLYGGFRDAVPTHPADTSLAKSAETVDLEEAAMSRVQELLAEEEQANQLAAAANNPRIGERGAKPIWLSSVFSAISTQARRFVP